MIKYICKSCNRLLPTRMFQAKKNVGKCSECRQDTIDRRNLKARVERHLNKKLYKLNLI